MSNKPDRPEWPCACAGDHRMTRDRAWCGDCSEWCYPVEGMLCVRGESVRMAAQLVTARADLAAARFAEREWRTKAQDLMREREEGRR